MSMKKAPIQESMQMKNTLILLSIEAASVVVSEKARLLQLF